MNNIASNRILTRLNDWLDAEISSFKNGGMMSMAESTHGEINMTAVSEKIKRLTKDEFDADIARAREHDDAMAELYGKPVNVEIPTPSKLDMLFIRACKVEDSDKRLMSLYRRYYIQNDSNKFYITAILMRIVEQYIPIAPSTLVSKMNPIGFNKYDSEDYFNKLFHVLVNHIALTPIDKIPSYIIPKAWRPNNA